MSNRFGIQQIKLNNVLYPGVGGYQIDRGVEVSSDGSDGTVYQTAHYITRRKPVAELTSLGLKAMIAVLTDSLDFPVLALDGTNGLIMWAARQAANAAGYASGSVHVTRTGLIGLIYLAGIRWSLGRPAEAMLRAMFLSADGTTQAVSEASTAALPTAPTPDFGFTLSALTLNGSAISRVNSFEMEIDPRFEFDHSAGLPEPVAINGAGSNGKLAITAKADVGDIDIGAGTGACSAVFTRFANGGGLGTDTVTLTFNSAWSNEESIAGQNNQPMTKPLLVRTRHNGTTRPLTWALG